LNPPEKYWDTLYSSKKTGWDIGYVSTPIKEYFDQLKDKSIRILIPGAGRAWEAEYIYKLGFTNTFILDFSKEAILEFKNRCPWFPENQIIYEDYFIHSETYNLIVEQTFFSSFNPLKRHDIVYQYYKLLNNGGKLVGVLFNHEFDFDGPPFGGSEKEYKHLFDAHFNIEIFKTAYNSIAPRKEREVFLLLRKK